jgi:Lipase (class 3)
MRSSKRLCLAYLLLLFLLRRSGDRDGDRYCWTLKLVGECHAFALLPRIRATSTRISLTTLAYWTPVHVIKSDEMIHRVNHVNHVNRITRKALKKAMPARVDKPSWPIISSLLLRVNQIVRSKYTRWIIISIVAARLAWALLVLLIRRGTANIEKERRLRLQELDRRQSVSIGGLNLGAATPAAAAAAAAAKQPFDWRTNSSGANTPNPREKPLSPSYMNPTLQRHQQMPFLNKYGTTAADALVPPEYNTNRQSPYFQQQPQPTGIQPTTNGPYPSQSSGTWNGNLHQPQVQPNHFQPQFPQVNGYAANGGSTPYAYQTQNQNSLHTANSNQSHQSPPPHQQAQGAQGQALDSSNPVPQQQMQTQNPRSWPQVQTFEPTSSASPFVSPFGTIHPPPDAAMSQLQTVASSAQPPQPTTPNSTKTKPQPKRIDVEKEQQRLAQEAHWQQIILDGRHDILHPSLRRLFSSPDAIPVIQTLLHHLELVAATASSIEHLRNNVVGRRRAWMLLRHVQHRSYCIVYDANEDRAIVAIGDLSSQFQTEKTKDESHQRDLLTNIVAYKNTLFDRGIVEDALELRRDILDCLKTTMSPHLPVIFVGHGRGGAIAAVLGLLQHQERQRPVEVVAFDPPPIWNVQESTLNYMTSIVCEQDFMPSATSSSSSNTPTSSSTSGAPNNTLVIPGRVIVLYERDGKVDTRIAPPPVHRASNLEEVYQLFEEYQSKHPGAIVGAVYHADGSSLGSSAAFRMDPDHEIAVQHDKLKRLVNNLKSMNKNPKKDD